MNTYHIAPRKSDPIPDNTTTKCMNNNCKQEFGWSWLGYWKKCHCRHCGLIFCSDCCNTSFSKDNYQKLCKYCHEHYNHNINGNCKHYQKMVDYLTNDKMVDALNQKHDLQNKLKIRNLIWDMPNKNDFPAGTYIIHRNIPIYVDDVPSYTIGHHTFSWNVEFNEPQCLNTEYYLSPCKFCIESFTDKNLDKKVGEIYAPIVTQMIKTYY